MSRQCTVTGKKTTTGNNVSHANNKTRRQFLPNLQSVSFYSDLLKKKFKLRVSVNGKRTIEHAGGLDLYLQRQNDSRLAPELLRIKKTLKKAIENMNQAG